MSRLADWERYMDTSIDDGGRADLGKLLDSLLIERILPKRWARRIWRSGDLPPRLEQRVRRLPAGVTWRAYTDGTLVWFAVPTAATSQSSSHGSYALQAHFFDSDGNYCAAGVWQYSNQHGWRLQDVLDHGAPDLYAAGSTYAQDPQHNVVEAGHHYLRIVGDVLA
jgi:hypothetical protein